MGLRIRSKLFSRIMQQEIGFFDTTKTGDITSRLSSDCKTMVDTLSLNTNIFLRSSVKAIGCLVLMFRLSWNLSLVTIIARFTQFHDYQRIRKQRSNHWSLNREKVFPWALFSVKFTDFSFWECSSKFKTPWPMRTHLPPKLYRQLELFGHLPMKLESQKTTIRRWKLRTCFSFDTTSKALLEKYIQ